MESSSSSSSRVTAAAAAAGAERGDRGYMRTGVCGPVRGWGGKYGKGHGTATGQDTANAGLWVTGIRKKYR